MPKFAHIVMGPAGSGKSTYCSLMKEHLGVAKRPCQVVNCDPAAEHFNYEVAVDVRDLIQLEDVMEDEDLKLGPNGGLIFCMEYIVKNMETLIDSLDPQENDYFIFDFPGQIELYTHLPVMRKFVDALTSHDFRVCGVFLVDAQFLGDPSKFISGVLSSLSCMVNLEIAHISVMSKLDMLPQSSKNKLEQYMESESLLSFCQQEKPAVGVRNFATLTASICELIEGYGMVKFLPLDRSEKETIDDILQSIDMILQYDDEQEVKTEDFDGDEKD